MAHLGNTIINGALRVIGGENVDTINGVTVGSSPKFTDASVTQTATTTNANYEVLFSATADNTTRTEGARKTNSLRFNPSTRSLMEGASSVASGNDSHAEGNFSTASGSAAHAEGLQGYSSGQASHAEGNSSSATGNYSHAEGQSTLASNTSAHAEGTSTVAGGSYSHAEGYATIASGSDSHAEGYGTSAIGTESHAEGYWTVANGIRSHVEGYKTTAMNAGDHAEGNSTEAYGTYSHAEGNRSVASSLNSHAEGEYTRASGTDSHAEGYYTTASGNSSHASGQYTSAAGAAQFVIGKYNVADTTSAFIIGNGTSSARSNALKVGFDGQFYTDYVMTVGKTSSRSTSTTGTWTAMCRNDQTGSPTCPTSKWWNIINLNNWTNSSSNWVSQLAVATQDDVTKGVWWRCNDSGGTDISSSTWHRCIDDTLMYTHGGFFAVGGGNDVSSDGTLYYSRVDVASADQSVGIQVSPYTGMFYGWQSRRSTGVKNYVTYWYSSDGGTAGVTRDCNAICNNGVFYYTSNGPTHGFQSTDGGLYAQFHSAPWGGQIAQDYRDGDLCVRAKNNGSWTAWRPIPAGLTYSNGNINTNHSRNCNDWANSSGFFYFLSGGPDSISGWKAPDASGTGFTHNYSSNSWANQWAQDFYDDGAMYVRSNTGGTWGLWQRLIDSSQIGTARIDRTDSAASWLQIKLNYGSDCLNEGMFVFKVTLYDSYVMRVYQVSGYCYGDNHWYQPRIVKLAQAGSYGDNNSLYDSVYFRYDSNHNLYVYIYQGSYAGALISDVCNGYRHITNLNRLFNLSYVSSVGNTAQASANLFGRGNFDVLNGSSFLYKSLTPSAAGTCSLYCYGGVKMLTIWGTTWAATSGGAREVMSITDSNFKPIANIEIFGHDDNGAAVFGYITNTGSICIANRNAVPVYITATYI